MNRKDAGRKAEPPISFEAALSRLEEIVKDLEGKDLTLEETLARYEEGSRLVGECARRLDEAEQRIRTLAAGKESPGGEAPGEERAADEPPGEDEAESADGDLPF